MSVWNNRFDPVRHFDPSFLCLLVQRSSVGAPHDACVKRMVLCMCMRVWGYVYADMMPLLICFRYELCV